MDADVAGRGKRGDVEPEGSTGELLNARFRKLVDDLGAEHAYARGWKKQVAEQLGLTPPHLSRIVKGERGVSLETAQKAASRVGFGIAYFVSGSPEDDVSYRDFPAGGSSFLYVELGGRRAVVADAPRIPDLQARAIELLPKAIAGTIDEEAVRELALGILDLPFVVEADQVVHREKLYREQVLSLLVQFLAFTGGSLEALKDQGEAVSRALARWGTTRGDEEA